MHFLPSLSASNQWRILTYTDGGANRELGLSTPCFGISYCDKPIRVRPHRFTRHGIIEEKTFSVIKGKVWLPHASMGIGLNRMQINSIVICRLSTLLTTVYMSVV